LKQHCSLAIKAKERKVTWGKEKGRTEGLRGEKRRKKTERKIGKGQGNEQDRGEQIFCPCFFSKKQRHSCLVRIVAINVQQS
jgi:hypothetical protein